MLSSSRCPISFAAFVPLALAACVSATGQSSQAVPATSGAAAPPTTPAEEARADSGRARYTQADAQFMQGMIAHHAQAVVMAGWAPTHGAREDVRILASRIDVAQRDEIAFMQRWLRERKETTPDLLAQHDMPGMSQMPGMAMPAMPAPGPLMPGMLTPAQMAQLSAATGTQFDRLFLTFMIQHHQGALTMVNHLFASPGSAQEEYVFRFASDVSTDQTTEIDRMRLMLSKLP